MYSFLDIYKNSDKLHHAYYFVDHKLEETVTKLKEFLQKKVGVKSSGNPDFWYRKFETFTIDDARDFTEASNRKSFTRDSSGRDELATGLRIFIIETDFITEEAQNALLKVFEEPNLGTHFFIVSPQEILLPTLRSRMQVFINGNESRSKLKSVFEMDLKQRLGVVKEITDGIKDEDMTKQDAISLLNQIERELYNEGVEKKYLELKACESARASLYDRGAPVKIILENLMLSI